MFHRYRVTAESFHGFLVHGSEPRWCLGPVFEWGVERHSVIVRAGGQLKGVERHVLEARLTSSRQGDGVLLLEEAYERVSVLRIHAGDDIGGGHARRSDVVVTKNSGSKVQGASAVVCEVQLISRIL